MGQTRMGVQANPSTPGAGTAAIFPNTTTKEMQQIDDSGKVTQLRVLTNAATGVTANTSDTYLTGSSIAIPPQLLRVGTQFKWVFAMTKTGAGSAQNIWTIRFGTAGTTADTGRVTITNVAATAVVDTGCAEITAVVTTSGASGILQAIHVFNHVGTANTQQTGLINQPTDVKFATSAAFDMTVASSIMGVSCNPGASGVWTFTLISAMCFNV